MQGVRDQQAPGAHDQLPGVEPRPGRGGGPAGPGAAVWRRPQQLRSQAALALLLGLLVLVTLLAATFIALNREQDASGRLQQARVVQVDNLQLLIAMGDQETALRGYAGTGQATFLETYRSGREEQRRQLDQLVAEARGTGSEAAVAQVQATAGVWSEWADGREAAIEAARGPVAAPAADQHGAALFASFRAADDRLTGELSRLVERGMDGLAGSRAQARGAVLFGGPVVLVCLLALASLLLFSTLGPVQELARTAERLAAGARAGVPHVERRDEVGTLARALQDWRQAEMLRSAVIEHAPIGICNIALDGTLISVNPELAMMLGYDREELQRMNFADVTDPRFVRLSWRLYNQVAAGERERFTLEKLYRRKDGSTFWGQLTVAGVQGHGHGADSFVAMVADVSQRRDRAARAAQVQRDVLPRMVPLLLGYELAGHCAPAAELGGDFFDWYLSAPGELTLTLGDVMGRGTAAAMLTTAIRAALRSAAQLSDPAQAVRPASQAGAPDLGEAQNLAALGRAPPAPRDGDPPPD